jgi:hypothetical protein
LDDFLGPEEMNATCREMTHMEMMDSCFTILIALLMASLENVEVFIRK